MSRKALAELCKDVATLYSGRTPLVKAIVYGWLSEQHVLVAGAPGLAKSEVANQMVARVAGWEVFYEQFMRGLSDQSVLGPFNLPELVDQGKFNRDTSGYLPTAHAFVADEIGKADPNLLHSMLGILNERTFKNGTAKVDVPLISAVGTTNEMIGEGDDAEANQALFDRFLIRLVVHPVDNPAAFFNLCTMSAPKEPTQYLTLEELRQDIANTKSIKVSQQIIEQLYTLRVQLDRVNNIRASDRRWRASIRLLQAAAYMRGDTEVKSADFAVLAFTLWSKQDDINVVTDHLEEFQAPGAREVREVTLSTTQMTNDFRDMVLAGDPAKIRMMGREVVSKCKTAINLLARSKHPDAKKVIDALQELINIASQEILENAK